MNSALATMNRSPATSLVQMLYCSGSSGLNGVFKHDTLHLAKGTDFTESTQMMSVQLDEGELDDCLDEVDSVSQLHKSSSKNCLKSLLFSAESSNADGSLPASPETPSSPVDSSQPGFTPAADAQLAQETRELIAAYLFRSAGLPCSRISNGNKSFDTLVRVGDSVIEKHKFAFNGMLRKLNISQEGDMGFMTPVAESIFSDGVINWGRVVSLVAFGAVVAKHLKQVNLERCIRPLADQISTFLLTRQKDWIVNNRAWEGFVEFFRIEDPEAGIRQALITFAGMAGLGAGIAYLIR